MTGTTRAARRAKRAVTQTGVCLRACRGGLPSHELLNWSGNAETLWNAAEQAETRGNARVARELRPSLAAELTLPEQVRLVRGFCLWLRDTYGVAAQADIHAPRFHDPALERRLAADDSPQGRERYLAALSDPSVTTLNYHAHILIATREVCRETGAFGPKTRILDDRKSGPQEIARMRMEWEKRTNAALRRTGSPARIDMRSYAAMSVAGDAPEGLVGQDHLGPRRAARSRRLTAETGRDSSAAGRRREEIRTHNAQLWQSWLMLRALEREKSRKEAERTAREREQARRTTAAKERERLHAAKPAEAEDEFSEEVDLETFEPQPQRAQPEPVLRPQVARVRRRGQRVR